MDKSDLIAVAILVVSCSIAGYHIGYESASIDMTKQYCEELDIRDIKGKPKYRCPSKESNK